MDAEVRRRFEEMLKETIGEQVNLQTKEMQNKIDELAKKLDDLGQPVPQRTQPIHVVDGYVTKGVVHDDGVIQQVGDTLFRLPQGAVVNPSYRNITSKGYRYLSGGLFVSPSEPMLEFADKVRDAVRKGATIRFVTKGSVSVSDAVSAQDDSSAGLFVPEDIRYALLQFAPPGTIVWPRAQVWPMTTDKIQWPKLKQDLTQGSENFFGNVELRWTEEGGRKQNTQPEFEIMALECHEISAACPVTDQLLQDSAINIGNLLVQLFQGAYWHGTDRAFLQGMGGAQPMGVLNTPGITLVKRITAGKVEFRDLLNMHSVLPPMFDANAVWFMKKSVFNDLRKKVDDVGQPVIQLGQGYNDFGEGIAGYALGLPVVMSDYKTSDLGQTGDVVLGDWKHYFIGERKTISVEMSRHVHFYQNMTAFRASARVGGRPEQEVAFVVLSSEADASMT